RRIRRSTSELRVELTPLIDVVFLLLTFFVFATLLMVRVDVLGLNLPGIGTGRPAEPVQVIRITLLANGVVLVDGTDARESPQAEDADDAWLAAAQQARSDRPDAQVLLFTDRDTGTGRLIEVLDRLRSVGIEEVGIVGQPEGEAAPESE
ncbi:MAG: biopolymer transporter ExbD, partial [Planctomycetota bacterium]